MFSLPPLPSPPPQHDFTCVFAALQKPSDPDEDQMAETALSSRLYLLLIKCDLLCHYPHSGRISMAAAAT